MTPSPPVAAVLSGGRGSAVVRGSETAARRLERGGGSRSLAGEGERLGRDRGGREGVSRRVGGLGGRS